MAACRYAGVFRLQGSRFTLGIPSPHSPRVPTRLSARSFPSVIPCRSLSVPLASDRRDSAPANAAPGDSVSWGLPKLHTEPGKAIRWESQTIQVVFKADDIVAVNKPPGIMVHSSREAPREERERRAFVKDIVERQLGLEHPLFPAHRIDRAASGVLVFGRTAEACRRVRAAMAHPLAVKEYLVLARGSPPDAFTCDRPLTDDKGVVRPCQSHFTKLLDLPHHRCALLSARISTGRRHQIRRHLNHLAFQIIGDSVYGKGRTNTHFRQNHHLPPSRLFLHASRLLLPLNADDMPHLHSSASAQQFLDSSTNGSSFLLPRVQAQLSGGVKVPWCLSRNEEPLEASEQNQIGSGALSGQEASLEIRAPLPDDLVNVLLSLGLTINDINNIAGIYD